MVMLRVLTVVAVVLAAVPASAQEAPAAPNLPRVEFGLGAGSGLWLGEAAHVGAIDLRVTGRLTPRFGIEFVTDILANDLSADRAYGVYILQGAYLVRGSRSGGLAMFATFGGLGGFERYRSRGGSWTAPDGQVYTWPAESRTEVYPATELVGGVPCRR
jgi:hypothetical protein